MELWQIDVMGGVMLEGGTELKAITGIDDHSRYCVMATLVHRATARPVCEALMDALSRYGVPEQILTDNGKVFTGRLAPKPSTVAFDRICLNNGIRHLLTAPYSPTTTGKIERLHKTIRKELVSGRTFTTIEQAQAELDAWVARYNGERASTTRTGPGRAPGPVSGFRGPRSDRLRLELDRRRQKLVGRGDPPQVPEPQDREDRHHTRQDEGSDAREHRDPSELPERVGV
jgi:hypothetical protein